jgi:metal-dependent HD superfamily phosphatase/phosphodiesterase
MTDSDSTRLSELVPSNKIFEALSINDKVEKYIKFQKILTINKFR